MTRLELAHAHQKESLTLPHELIHACRRGQIKRIVKWLKAGGCVNARCPSLTGNSLLHAASVHEQAELMLLLLQHKACVDLQNNEGSTALMAASEQAKFGTEAVRMLLERGAQCNMQCDRFDGCTALTSAARNGQHEVLLLLLEHGADPDHHTEKLGSPLMQAAGAGHIACVRALLEAGADISLQTKHQRTALDLALRHGHAEVAAILRRAQDAATPKAKMADREVDENAARDGSGNGRARVRRELLSGDLRSHA